MAKPVLQQSNAVGNVLKGSDLGLAAGTVLATSSPKDLTTFRTPVPETMLMVVRQSSGTATYTVDVNATGGYSAADYTLSSLADTTQRFLLIDTDTTNSYVSIRIATSANAIIDRFGVVSLSKLTAGEEYRSVLAGRNAVAGLEGTANSDGSGVWSSDLNVSA